MSKNLENGEKMRDGEIPNKPRQFHEVKFLEKIVRDLHIDALGVNFNH